MGKMIERAQKNGARAKHKLAQLRRQRQELAARLAALDARISRMSPKPESHPTGAAFDQWLDQMSAGLPNLPTLPADFGRAEIYTDHD
jgi:hypothetical protein